MAAMRSQLYITSADLKRLERFLSTKDLRNVKDNRHLESLQLKLGRAIVVKPENIPGDVITMNSQVHLTNLETGEKMVWTLAFPWNANIDEGKISILAPVGTAIIGCKSKDVIELEVPSGSIRLKIDEILYQPEAAGNLNL